MNILEGYRIHLNFLPIVGEIPEFEISRRLVVSAQEIGQRETMFDALLPKEAAEMEDRAQYWVVFQPREGFEVFRVKSSFNNHLTVWALFKAIGEQCTAKLAPEDFWLSQGGFLREIHLNMRPHDEGDEQLVIQPYRLRVTQIGVLADFIFG